MVNYATFPGWICGLGWCLEQDSNLRQVGYEPTPLPTEVSRHINVGFSRFCRFPRLVLTHGPIAIWPADLQTLLLYAGCVLNSGKHPGGFIITTLLQSSWVPRYIAYLRCFHSIIFLFLYRRKLGKQQIQKSGMVGNVGLEPTASGTQIQRSSQTELIPGLYYAGKDFHLTCPVLRRFDCAF